MSFVVEPQLLVFLATLLATFGASYLGRRHASTVKGDGLSSQHLNRWLVGLSAGATANSGFVVTGAVGLGYSFGAHWLLLPLAWLLGDIVFWSIFPSRINRMGEQTRAKTLTDLIVHGLSPAPTRAIQLLSATIILLCLSGYVAAQWIAGATFLRGAFGIDGIAALVAFATLIIGYSAIGGFRGSVYADSFQAILRIIGTSIALAAVCLAADQDRVAFWTNIEAAGPDFLRLFPGSSLPAAAAFVLGFGAASLGFGLGQPQMVTRYLAGASPSETRAAALVYNAFVQVTWVAMTLFGIVLRGVMPDLDDPESGLSAFFRTRAGPILGGIIIADIFATIAATSNSLLVAMAQTTRGDITLGASRSWLQRYPEWVVTASLGAATMAISLSVDSSVVTMALSSVSLMGAALAPSVMIRVLGWRHSGESLVTAIVVGLLVAILWRFAGLEATMNEAAPGMFAGLATNWLVATWRAWRGIA